MLYLGITKACNRFVFVVVFHLIVFFIFHPVEAAIPNYEIYPNHPRLFFRDTDKATLKNRTTDINNWKSEWAKILSWCEHNKNRDNSDLASSSPDKNLITFAFVGWLENNAEYKNKAISVALYLSSLDSKDNGEARDRVLAMAFVYDTLYNEPEMSKSSRERIGKGILQQFGKLNEHTVNGVSDERIAGHSRGNMVYKFIGAAAVANDNWESAPNDWKKYANEALLFWYEDEIGYMETVRYYCQNGGHLQGAWYTVLITSHDLLFFSSLANATKNVNPFVQEDWVAKIPEWFVNTIMRGDDEMLAYMDTFRTASPIFQTDTRLVTTILANRFDRGELRWIYERLNKKDNFNSPNVVMDVIFLDKTKGLPVSPSLWRYPKSRLFNPPGTYFYRTTWEYPQSTIIHINAESHYTMVHQHLDVGSISIAWKDDMVLLAPTGIYKDNFGDEHHRNWYARSVGHSGVPRVTNPADYYERHSNSGRNDNDPANDGGQHWKKFDGPNGTKSSPYNIRDLLDSGNGNAWKNGEFQLLEETADYVYLKADIKQSYQKRHTDPLRTPINEIHYLILKERPNHPYPMVLVYHKIKSANSNWKKVIPWHFGSVPTENKGRIIALGGRKTGKIVIDIFDPSRFQIATFGPGDYSYQGRAWPPETKGSSRDLLDLGGSRAEISPSLAQQHDEIVSLLMPMGANEEAPLYTWIQDPDWYGIRLGNEVYRIHKTLNRAIKENNAQFVRGDINPNGKVELTDAVVLLGYLFQGEAEPSCLKAADVDDDGKLSLSDSVYLLGYLFRGGPAPRSPFSELGIDPTLDDLSCETYPLP